MPAKSKAQQKAAGIAYAVKKGKIPKSKLKGASKSMYESMSGKELDKYASTKRKNLLKYTKSKNWDDMVRKGYRKVDI